MSVTEKENLELESRIQEMERERDIFKNERDELRELHNAGIKEAYRICGIEDDGEYRWKWVLLEFNSMVKKIKELEEGIKEIENLEGDKPRAYCPWCEQYILHIKKLKEKLICP